MRDRESGRERERVGRIPSAALSLLNMRRELSSVCWIAAQSLEPGHTVSTPWIHFKVKRVKVALKEKEK